MSGATEASTVVTVTNTTILTEAMRDNYVPRFKPEAVNMIARHGHMHHLKEPVTDEQVDGALARFCDAMVNSKVPLKGQKMDVGKGLDWMTDVARSMDLQAEEDRAIVSMFINWVGRSLCVNYALHSSDLGEAGLDFE